MSRIIDLSHPLKSGQPVFPGDREISIVSQANIDVDGYNLTTVHMSAHHGTHIDAASHFVPDGMTVDRIPLERLYGPARLIRIPKQAGDIIAIEDFLPFEGLFVAGARIIFETGFYKKFGTPDFFDRYPSMDVETAEWIASKRIGLLGTDLPSPGMDYGPVHRAIMGPKSGTLIVESLANLDICPAEFIFVGFPLRLEGREGSPIRAAAIID